MYLGKRKYLEGSVETEVSHNTQEALVAENWVTTPTSLGLPRFHKRQAWKDVGGMLSKRLYISFHLPHYLFIWDKLVTFTFHPSSLHSCEIGTSNLLCLKYLCICICTVIIDAWMYLVHIKKYSNSSMKRARVWNKSLKRLFAFCKFCLCWVSAYYRWSCLSWNKQFSHSK